MKKKEWVLDKPDPIIEDEEPRDDEPIKPPPIEEED